MSDQQAPDPAVVKETVGKLDQFIAYVVEVLRGKGWTKKLLLLDVLLFTVFNSVFFTKILKLFGVNDLPQRYTLYFWLVIGTVFVAALVTAWRERPKEKIGRDPGERSAIKGLLPYVKNDSALFARLQREQDLTECSQAITASHFRFGVLCGESGNGKTSFLQAGLWPALQQNNHRCVYVKCTEMDPVEAIRQAVIEEFAPPDTMNATTRVSEILEAAARLDSKPLVVILDQFEQFFVHRQRKKDRGPFLAAMEEWYKGQAALPVKIVVCLRSDFLDRMIELQKLMGYSLGPQQSFRLDKFAPAQAAEIFRVIAEHEKLEYDSGFVEKMTAEELAGAADGLISPVDIQVLAWMIAGQKVEQERAFDEKTFRKLGGVEGLLERFLTRALDVRETEQRRQAAVKVLLGLTDLDRNTRAGVLTTAELEEKLRDHLPRAEIAEAIEWLARGDVRLIAPVKRKKNGGGKDVEGYELAHERLIPALRRIAGKQLRDPDRAEQLLDRRTNEWLGSGRASRYLFSWSELRLIDKYRQLIAWGKERQSKEALLAASRRRFRLRYAAAGFAILLCLAVWIGWNSNAWQTRLIRGELNSYGGSLNDGHALRAIAQAFVYAGDWRQLFKVLERVQDDDYKVSLLRAIAESYASLGDREEASALLAEAVGLTRDGYSKAPALRAIADSYAKLGDKEKAPALLAAAVETAGLMDDYYKVDELRLLAESYAQLGDKEKARALLVEAVKTTRLIAGVELKAHILQKITKSFASVGGTTIDSMLLTEAVKTVVPISDDFSQTSALSAIVELGETTKNQALLAEAVKIAGLISRDSPRVYMLGEIAVCYANLGDEEKARALLAEAVKSVGRISEDSSNTSALSTIAQSHAKLGETLKDTSLLAEAIKIAELISDRSSKAFVLRAIAESYAKLGETLKDTPLLTEGVKTARLINVDPSRASALGAIAESYARLGETLQDTLLLAEAVKTAELINADPSKAFALRVIAESYAKLGDKEKATALLAEAVKTARVISIGIDRRPFALRAIAESYAKLGETMKDSALLAYAVKIAGLISDDSNKVAALSAIAASYAKLAESSNDRALYAQTFPFIEGLGSDDRRDTVLQSILSSRLAVADVGRLRALAAHFSSEAGKAQALARILIAVSHPELIEKEKETEDGSEQ